MLAVMTNLTETEFVRREIAHWGEEHVDDLIERGFIPILLDNGKWMWQLQSDR